MTTPDREQQARGRRAGLASAEARRARMLATYERYCTHRSLGFSQEDSAQRCGISDRTAERYERSRRQRIGGET